MRGLCMDSCWSGQMSVAELSQCELTRMKLFTYGQERQRAREMFCFRSDGIIDRLSCAGDVRRDSMNATSGTVSAMLRHYSIGISTGITCSIFIYDHQGSFWALGRAYTWMLSSKWLFLPARVFTPFARPVLVSLSLQWRKKGPYQGRYPFASSIDCLNAYLFHLAAFLPCSCPSCTLFEPQNHQPAIV
jgi:hypothetical protein